MKKRWNTHISNANASKLHKQVFQLLRERFPGFTITQEYPIEVYDSLDKKHILYFDISIREIGIVIECQGKQHYEANSHFYEGREEFEKAKTRDSLKKIWCEMNDISLVELKYNDKITIELIEQKINKALGN